MGASRRQLSTREAISDTCSGEASLPGRGVQQGGGLRAVEDATARTSGTRSANTNLTYRND